MTDIGDIIRSSLATAEPAAPESVETQVRPATSEELAEIEEIAQKAAQIQDELNAVVDERPGQLKKLKAELRDRMMRHGMRELVVAGRPPIELAETNSRKPTRKAIVEVLQEAELKKLTDEQRRDPKAKKKAMNDGKMKALNLWNAIAPSTSYSVKIPNPTPPEVESPY